MKTIELTDEELKELWTFCMANLTEDIKPIVKKLTLAIKGDKHDIRN